MNEPVPLSFSHEFQISESEYVQLWGLVSRRTRMPRYLVAVALGIAMLMWSYTLVIGIIVLVSAFLHPLLSLTVPGTALATFRKTRHLHQPIKYTLSDDGLEAHAANLRVWSAWENLYLWRITGPWLILSAHGSPNFYFRVADLEAAGIWDRVEHLVRTHAAQYNSPEPRRL